MGLLVSQGVLIGSLLVGNHLPSTPPTPPQSFMLVKHIDGLEDFPILHQLIGTWRGEDPTTQAPIVLVFNPLGQVYLLVEDEANNPTAIKMWYEINTFNEPFQLDLQLNAEQTAPTVFAITPQGQLRLRLEGISPEAPRPETLETATPFEKISESTAIAPEFEVVQLAPPETTVSVPVQYISILAKSQIAYYLETEAFTENLADLGVTGSMETQQYSYAFETFDENPNQVAITAEPKEGELSSYIGAIFVQAEGSNQNIIAGICQTDNPTTLPPAMPTLEGQDIFCPAGSTLVQE